MKRFIKTFTNNESDEEINKFLTGNNATPISLTSENVHDNYSDGSVCNQWVQRTLIYESESEGE